MKNIFTVDPYQKFGGKPEFIKEIEQQNITNLRSLWKFIFSFRDQYIQSLSDEAVEVNSLGIHTK